MNESLLYTMKATLGNECYQLLFISYKVQLYKIECGEYREEMEVLDEAADDDRVTFVYYFLLYYLIIISFITDKK